MKFKQGKLYQSIGNTCRNLIILCLRDINSYDELHRIAIKGKKSFEVIGKSDYCENCNKLNWNFCFFELINTMIIESKLDEYYYKFEEL